jgi:hypothetical protein
MPERPVVPTRAGTLQISRAVLELGVSAVGEAPEVEISRLLPVPDVVRDAPLVHVPASLQTSMRQFTSDPPLASSTIAHQ